MATHTASKTSLNTVKMIHSIQVHEDILQRTQRMTAGPRSAKRPSSYQRWKDPKTRAPLRLSQTNEEVIPWIGRGMSSRLMMSMSIISGSAKRIAVPGRRARFEDTEQRQRISRTGSPPCVLGGWNELNLSCAIGSGVGSSRVAQCLGDASFRSQKRCGYYEGSIAWRCVGIT